jgi:protein-tyrosine kinase
MSLIERAAGMVEKLAESAGKPAVAKKTEVPLIERAVNNKDHSYFEPTPNRLSEAGMTSPSEMGRTTPRVRHIDLDRLRKQSIMTPDQERSAISENFRRIKRHILSNVGKSNSERNTNLIMITSALPGEGKTFCAINLAISIAMEMDRTVLLVDADVARPSVTATLGIRSEDELGLMDILCGDSIDVASILCKTNLGKLSVIPAGSHHVRSTEILASERMRRLLEELS